MTENEILDSVLLALADDFEEPKGRPGVEIKRTSPEEYEALRECLAMRIAEGSLTQFQIESQKLPIYRFTNPGYAKYKPRIDWLRL